LRAPKHRTPRFCVTSVTPLRPLNLRATLK
jgi:hypothetical protein